MATITQDEALRQMGPEIGQTEDDRIYAPPEPVVPDQPAGFGHQTLAQIKPGESMDEAMSNQVEQEKQNNSTTWNATKAAFNQIPILKAVDKLSEPDSPNDPNFNLVNTIKGTQFEPMIDQFVGVHSQQQFLNRAQEITTTQANLKAINDAGFPGKIQALAVGMLDPVWIPAMFVGAGEAGFAAKVLKTAGAFGTTEAVEQQLGGDNRPTSARVMDILGSAMLGGVMGGASAWLHPAPAQTIKDLMEQTIKDPTNTPTIQYKGNVFTKDALDAEVQRLTDLNEKWKIKPTSTINKAYIPAENDYVNITKQDENSITGNLSKSQREITIDKSEARLTSPEDIQKNAIGNLTHSSEGKEYVKPEDNSKYVGPGKGYFDTPDQQHLGAGAEATQTNVGDSGLAGKMGGFKMGFGKFSVQVSPRAMVRIFQNPVAAIGWGEVRRNASIPVLEGLSSESAELRNITQKLFETQGILKKNTEAGGFQGTEIPVTERIRQDHDETGKYSDEINQEYNKYLGSKDGHGLIHDTTNYISAKQQKKMDTQQMANEVGWAMIHEDNHENPFVTRMAQKSRQVIEYWNKKLQEVDMLDKNLKPEDLSYLTRVWNTEKIMKSPDGFMQDAKASFMKSGLDEEKAEFKAQDMLENLLGVSGRGTNLSDYAANLMTMDKGVAFTKTRQWHVPTEDMWSWVDQDGIRSTTKYAEQASRIYNVKKYILDSYGANSVEGMSKVLKEEASNTPRLIPKLAQNQADLKDFLSLALGQARVKMPGDKFFGLMRKFNNVTMMQGVTITALPHTMVPIIKYGMGSYLTDGFGKISGEYANGASHAVEQEMRDQGFALDREIEGVLQQMIDPEGHTTGGKIYNTMNKGLDVLQHAGSKANLMSTLVQTSVRMSRHMAESKILRNLNNWDNLSVADRTYMAGLGFEDKEIQKINRTSMEYEPQSTIGYKDVLDQAKEFGYEENGSWIAGIDSWTNKEAKAAYLNALHKEVHSAVPTPGIGDRPLAAQKWQAVANLVQYTNFFAGFGAKTLIPGIQRHDANFVQGMMAVVSMGAASYILKEKIAGREPDTSVENLLAQGLSRSAFLGLMTQRIKILYGQATGNKELAEDYGQDPFVSMLGPTAGDIDKIYKIGQGVISDPSEAGAYKAAKAMIPFIPYNNAWQLRLFMTELREHAPNAYSKIPFTD